MLITAIIAGLIAGFLSTYTSIPRDKVFTCEGMSITLTNKFNTFENEYYTEVYDSSISTSPEASYTLRVTVIELPSSPAVSV